MLFVFVVAILLVMAVLALAGPVLEDLLEWVRSVSHRHGHSGHAPEGERVPRHSVHR